VELLPVSDTGQFDVLHYYSSWLAVALAENEKGAVSESVVPI
jgi:hypothetical protein